MQENQPCCPARGVGGKSTSGHASRPAERIRPASSATPATRTQRGTTAAPQAPEAAALPWETPNAHMGSGQGAKGKGWH